MATYVALLRGINVGGHNKVAMADLRAVVSSLGHTDVATYIQSGNVVFTGAVFRGAGAEPTAVAGAIEGAIAGALGVQPRVVVLTCDELAQVVAANPYPEEADPRRLHAVFRMAGVGAGEAEAVAAAVARAAAKGSRDEARLVGRTLYLRTPDGLGRSVLAVELGRAGGALHARSATTVRNWATVCRLLAMCG